MSSMPLVEVDLLLAYLVKEDKHHRVASTYFSKVTSGSLPRPVLSGFALQELELGVRTGRVLPWGRHLKTEGEVAQFIKRVCEALEVHGLRVQPFTCATLHKAAEFRGSYGLSYFDSLHAASAFFHDREIVSTDGDYDRVKELRRVDPYRL